MDYPSQTTIEKTIEAAFKGSEGAAAFGMNVKERTAHAEQLKNWFAGYYGGIDESMEKKKILKQKLSLIIGDPEAFMADLISGIRSYPKDKSQVALRIEHLLKYLQKNYSVSFDLKAMENYKTKSQEERLLRILRHLHSGSHSRAEIAETFGISERQLSGDLKTLQNGFEFLDTSMEILNLERGSNTYSSTIHPIFLSMNMSEIFALTVGLKLLGRDTLWESTLNGISDLVYRQLSDHAREIVDNHSEQNRIGFGEKAMRFVGSDKLMDEENRPFLYFMKEPIECEVTFYQDQKPMTVNGFISFEYEDQDCPSNNRIRICSTEEATDTIYSVHVNQVKSLRKATSRVKEGN